MGTQSRNGTLREVVQVQNTVSKVSTFLRYMGFPIERLIVYIATMCFNSM